jgi:hypothetical protein
MPFDQPEGPEFDRVRVQNAQRIEEHRRARDRMVAQRAVDQSAAVGEPIESAPKATREWLSRRRLLGLAATGLGVAGASTALGMPNAVADPYADLTLSNLTDYVAARNNLGTARIVTPEQFGAVGDGTTDDTDAIQDALDSVGSVGGGTVLFTARSYLATGVLINYPGITLTTLAQHRQEWENGVKGFNSCIQAPEGATGWIIDTPPLDPETLEGFIFGGAIHGLVIQGHQYEDTHHIGGVRLQEAYNFRISNCVIHQVSEPAVRLDAGLSLYLDDNWFIRDTSAITLTEPTGTLHVVGTDHYIRATQCNGGHPGRTTVVYPDVFYRAGAYFNCRTSWIYDLNGELSDVGIYLDEDSGANRFIGTRADVNAGHGWYVKSIGLNQFVGCSAMAAGGAARATYDGMHIAQGSINNTFTNWQYYRIISGNTQTARYGWYDANTGLTSANANILDMPNSTLIEQTHDMVGSAEPLIFSLLPSGSGPKTNRPPSRYMTGATWVDTADNSLTFSNGSVWLDSDGNVVGNLYGPDQSTTRTTLKWVSSGGKCIVSSLYYNQVTEPAQKLEMPRLPYGAANAAGVTAGNFSVAIFDRFPCTAGQTYTLGAYTVAWTVAANVKVGCQWINSVGGAISTTTEPTGVTNSATDPTLSIWDGFTAPAGAVGGQLILTFTRAGMALNEAHFMQKAFAVHGSVSDYVAP